MFTGRIVAQAARSAAPRASIAPRAAIRSYAQAANSASTRPPVPLYGVDGTYASALVRCRSLIAPPSRHLLPPRSLTRQLESMTLTAMTTVHRGRQILRPRPDSQGAGDAEQRFQEGRQAAGRPVRPDADRRRQEADHRRAAEAHWRRGQGGRCQKLFGDAR